MEKMLLSACMRSRESFDVIESYIDLKLSTYSKQFQILMGKVGEYYKRDAEASHVDASLLLAQITETIRNDKHIDMFSNKLEEAMSADVSDANVKAMVLMAKQQEVGDKLSQALVSDASSPKVNELIEELTKLRSLTSIDEVENEEIRVLSGTTVRVSDLINKELDPSNLIKLYPLALNDRIDGGAKRGHHITIFARPECLAHDTKVRVKFNPTSTSSKELTLAQFYKRFNRAHHLKGKGPYQIQSVTNEGKVFYNNVEDVIHSGIKEVFKIVAEDGSFVQATAEHVLLTARGDVKVKDLQLTDYLIVDARNKIPRKARKELCTKLPYSNYAVRTVSGQAYHRVQHHRIAFDAHLNNYSIEDFVIRLKVGGADSLIFSDSSMDIHHIDGDHTNNSPSNLALITREEHSAIHASAGDCDNGHRSEYSKVKSIEYVGERECYDICMNDKANNFRVNNGMYVHNCGKSATCVNMSCGFAIQKFRVLYLINEDREEDILLRHIYNLSNMSKYDVMNDPDKADTLARQRGLNQITVISLAPGTPKQIEELIDEHEPDCVIVDQLRNLKMRADNRVNQLEAAATACRTIAKKKNVLMISVTQAGDSADNKAVLEMGDIDYSNTGIPAQADLLIGIGMDATLEAEQRRMFSICKNKLSGNHSHFPVNIVPQLSRITNV